VRPYNGGGDEDGNSVIHLIRGGYSSLAVIKYGKDIRNVFIL
jgi:hypothetical protein